MLQPIHAWVRKRLLGCPPVVAVDPHRLEFTGGQEAANEPCQFGDEVFAHRHEREVAPKVVHQNVRQFGAVAHIKNTLIVLHVIE